MKYLVFFFCISLFGSTTEESSKAGLAVADEMVGTYIGKLQDPTLTNAIDNHSITITKLADDKIKVAPTSTTNSASFEATLTKANGIITLKSDTDVLLKNGLFMVSTGRFSYLYHLGGNEERNVQVFIGKKQ